MKGLLQTLTLTAVVFGGAALAAEQYGEQKSETQSEQKAQKSEQEAQKAQAKAQTKEERARCEDLSRKAADAKYKGKQLTSSELAEWNRQCAPTVYRGEPHGDSASSAEVESGGEVWSTGSSGPRKSPDIETKKKSEATGGAGEQGSEREPTEKGE